MASSSSETARELVQDGWRHLQLQRPLAAWACWQRALGLQPDQPAALEALQRLARAGDLPAAARAVYRFRQPRRDDRRETWDRAFRGRDLQILEQAASAFATILAEDPNDAAAHYDRALCLAWLGLNTEAIGELDAVVRLDADSHFEDASDAWLLAAVLRQGAGAETLADDFNHALVLPWGLGEPDPTELAPPDHLRPIARPVAAASPIDTAGVDVYEWLDRPMPAAEAGPTQADLPRVLATLFRTRETLKFVSPRGSDLLRVEELLDEHLPDEDHRDRRSTPLPLALLDAAIWTYRLPDGLDAPTRSRLSREAVEHYYESVWIRKPLNSLASDRTATSPLDAALAASRGDSVARAKLHAVIRFREQLGERPTTAALHAGYPFDRLRNRLGLEPDDPATIDLNDPSCLNPDQLRALDPSRLEASALADALQSARLFGIEELAARFAPRNDRT